MDSRINQLEKLLEQGREFTFENSSIRSGGRNTQYGGKDSPAWLTWKTRVNNVVSEAVEPQSAPMVLLDRAGEILTEGNGKEEFEQQKSLLISAVEQAINIAKEDMFGELKTAKSISSSSALSNRVFIVHGHDHALKAELETFLTSIGLEPIVLHRQPDQGRTLIEKFEQHSDVGFAFILLTPDEVAYTNDQEGLADDRRKKEARARPNVIFEFGYFVGRLGRQRVCCLVKGTVARPSDIEGLVYKPVNDSVENIGFSIIKELKAAGYSLKI